MYHVTSLLTLMSGANQGEKPIRLLWYMHNVLHLKSAVPLHLFIDVILSWNLTSIACH